MRLITYILDAIFAIAILVVTIVMCVVLLPVAGAYYLFDGLDG